MSELTWSEWKPLPEGDVKALFETSTCCGARLNGYVEGDNLLWGECRKCLARCVEFNVITNKIRTSQYSTIETKLEERAKSDDRNSKDVERALA